MLEHKLFKGKTLAILSGGGDTPAINSSIESVRNRASMLGYKVYGIRQGWKGLLGDGDIIDLTRQPYNGLYGGTALRSSRTNPFPSKKNPEDRIPQILQNLKRYKIDVLVTIGGDDTNGAAKRLYEQEGIPVIGFPKTIDNDLRTKTWHTFGETTVDAVVCPGFPTAAKRIAEFASILKTTAESHSRIMVMEVMGRDAGWLTGAGIFGGGTLSLVPEIEMNKERKDFFLERVKEAYLSNPKKTLIIPVSEGVRWYDDLTGKTDVVFASTEQDEYGHARLGGVSGIISSEISNKLKIDARAQVTGYYPRGGTCSEYDRRLTQTLADKVVDLLLREEYGQMPTLNKLCKYTDLEEFNCSSIDMGAIGNRSLPMEYFDANTFTFTPAYNDFLSKIIGHPCTPEFNYDFPIVVPEM
ncbi:MAG: pyrophosphate-dependent phosphofructokinase [Bacteroidetes bacterium]|nr:pyrophosphate-dependent phosphofructokinase [Bacteroidota bacterium]